MELLVVIGIIALLIGLLFVALSTARESARRTQTLTTMNAFLRACETFKLEHGFNPGLIPEDILASNNHQIMHQTKGFAMSSTENALLHLMGGYVMKGSVPDDEYDDLSDADGWHEFEIMAPLTEWIHFKFNLGKLGEGPRINGKSYGSYFTPQHGEVRVLDDTEQWPSDQHKEPSEAHLPDLVDAWDHPILYLHQVRNAGPIVGDAHVYAAKPKFYVDGQWPYTLTKSQYYGDPCDGGRSTGSILYFDEGGAGGPGNPLWPKVWAQILRHPALSPVDPNDPTVPGVQLGSIMLISAGADGVYYAADDGPGSASQPIGCTGCGNLQPYPIDVFLNNGIKVIDTFDDLRVHGGGS